MPPADAPVPDLPAIAAMLRSGQWNAAHDAIQRHDSLMGAWLHGIVHLQEGDLEDAENLRTQRTGISAGRVIFAPAAQAGAMSSTAGRRRSTPRWFERTRC